MLIDEREGFERADDDIEKANRGDGAEREVAEEGCGVRVLLPVQHAVSHHVQREGEHCHDDLQERVVFS